MSKYEMWIMQEDHYVHSSRTPEPLLCHEEDAAERILTGSAGGRYGARSGSKPRSPAATRLLSNPLFAPPLST